MLLTSSSNPLHQPYQYNGFSSKFHCGLHEGREVPTPSTNHRALPDITDPVCPGSPRPPSSHIHTRLDLPGWKRLIRSPPTTSERISLILAILSNGEEVGMVKCLCGDEAQNFIDAMYEARYHPIFSPENILADLRALLLIRRWVASTTIIHHG